MNGFCSHCRTEQTVWRYRIAFLGLRFLDVECAARLTAMGMKVDPVTNDDPRAAVRPLRWHAA